MVGFERGRGLAASKAAARVAQEHLGWDAPRTAREVAAYHNYVERLGCNGHD